MVTVWAALGRALSPVEDRPRVAPALESVRFTTRTGTEYVVIHNPATRAYARLDPREFELLDLMNGQHSVKELVIAYYQRHGVLALSRVAGLVGLLSAQGLLAARAVDAYADLRNRLHGGARGGGPVELTTTRVDAALGGLYRAWGHFFFHRAWLWVGLGLGLLGPLLVLWELARGRYVLYELGGSALSTIALLVGLALLALAIHELGHGLAVKHAGRYVHQAGVRLYFGLPAAYVDTSDIWMAPPRARLLTAFAGPWTGLVLGGLCAIAATLVPTGPAGAVLFTAAFVFLVDNLFNFNPLLELDGYYMLIDYLDRPLLRARALAFVRGPFWSRLIRRQPLSAEQRLLAAFGLGALGYGVLAIVLAVRAWQALLVPLIETSWASGEPLRQAGAVVMAGAVLLVVGGVLVGLVRRLTRRAGAWFGWLGGRAAARRHREALAALRAVPLWPELPPARLLELARAMRSEDVARGDEVVRQGEVGDCFYLIARGAFEVTVDGQPQSRLGRGDYFGERALLHRAPRAATVVAQAAGRVFVLERAAFEAFLASDLAVRARLETALGYRDAVAEMPLFRDLSSAELDLLLARLVPLSVEPGEVVLRQGESGERFYVVRSGMVEVERDGEVLARLGAGEAFGEIALLLDVPRTATVRAVERIELLALDAHDFRDLLAGYLGRAGELERLSHLRLRTHKRLDEVV
ncbi:MAG TPA: cyclic nucleotide-binding domain-containing protein [Chloroflexota bacterium]